MSWNLKKLKNPDFENTNPVNGGIMTGHRVMDGPASKRF